MSKRVKKKPATAKRTRKKPRAKSAAKAAARKSNETESLESYVQSKVKDLNKNLLLSPEWMGTTLSMVAPKNAIWMSTPKAQIFKIENFLSPEECEKMIKVCKPSLRPSTITSGEAGFRTSRTCDMAALEDEDAIKLTVDLDVKICNEMNIHPLYAEGTQFQYYQPGEYFKAHTDFFEPGSQEYKDHATELGQRTWTFMIFLNDVERGGRTIFNNVENGQVPAKAGTALAWNNLNKDGTVNRDTLHEGELVTKGYKAVVTKWFRDKRPV